MGQLHAFFFPMMAHGHMLPTLDMARLFALSGVKVTILTTPLNAPVFSKTIEKTKHLGIDIGLHLIKFPAIEAGLPEGCESFDQVNSDEMLTKFLKAISLFQEPLEQVLQEFQPNCLIADMYFPWATNVAANFNIPTLVFHGTSYFALCASERMTRKQVDDHNVRKESETAMTKLLHQVKDSDLNSYGVIVNSFYELEPDYADHYRKVLGRRAWHIGPLSLCNKDFQDKAQRGKKTSIDEHYCLEWLNSKRPNSVIYVCFGSLANLTAAQLYELAIGLDASGQQFIWVIRNVKYEEKMENWLPEGYKERMKGKGLIVRGWAPQVLILDHEAIGGFVTHCGWNSTLEGLSAGVTMVTWPLFADQFLNEKLVTQVLRTGVSIGAKESNRIASEGVKCDAIEKAVMRIMVGEEAEEMRSRAKGFKEMARKAVEDGGSSYSDLKSLIDELKSYCS